MKNALAILRRVVGSVARVHRIRLFPLDKKEADDDHCYTQIKYRGVYFIININILLLSHNDHDEEDACGSIHLVGWCREGCGIRCRCGTLGNKRQSFLYVWVWVELLCDNMEGKNDRLSLSHLTDVFCLFDLVCVCVVTTNPCSLLLWQCVDMIVDWWLELFVVNVVLRHSLQHSTR